MSVPRCFSLRKNHLGDQKRTVLVHGTKLVCRIANIVAPVRLSVLESLGLEFSFNFWFFISNDIIVLHQIEPALM